MNYLIVSIVFEEKYVIITVRVEPNFIHIRF